MTHSRVVAGMFDNEVRPGERAPATGSYEELNVFGVRTGKVLHIRTGEALPAAPRGFSWRLAQRSASSGAGRRSA
ncbi:MAG TPA: hypothetical protein VKT26_08650 [Acetobacteraceae bacterium]|nr:hypothetical protein [Acetobacteraceae bacterium]